MKTLLRILGITLGLIFLSYAIFIAWPEAIELGVFGILDILGFVVISGYFIFYGLTAESSIYNYFSTHRKKSKNSDT